MSYVENLKGPCAVLAGAGTGKTYSIIEKLKHIINKSAYPIERVVCLTFSNEAVNNLRERIIPHLKQKEPLIRTFHGFCADILRSYGSKIGIKENFKIITPDDGKILLHKNFKIAPILCNSYIEKISSNKDLGKKLEDFNGQAISSNEISNLISELEEVNFKINTNHIKKISKEQILELKNKKEALEKTIKEAKLIQTWKMYEKLKLANNGLDYSDLHNEALKLFEKYPEIADDFDYVIVDEFQDTNKIQCVLLDKIARKRNITVVGDLNQSIYGFRGAYSNNFNYFKEIFNLTEDKMFKLDKSHRSTNRILDIAHELIQNNYKNKEECFKVKSAYNIEGEKINIFELKNSKEEVRKIIEIIKKEIENNTPLNKICVIFRTHQQSSMLKKHLDYEKIPYISANKESLLKEQKIRLIRAYLNIADKITNKSNGGEASIWEIVNQNIKDSKDHLTITKEIQKWSREKKDCICEEFMKTDFKISENNSMILQSIRATINSISEISKSKPLDILKKLYELLGFEDKESIPSLEKFYSFVKDLPENEVNDLSGLLYHLNALDSLGINIEAPETINDGIKIMTNHATKGLEYDSVIISSLVQKKFPIERPETKPEDNDSQIQEERRLFYVGITRAKKRLYMTYAKEYGQRKYEPSQFLREIDYTSNQNIEFTKDDLDLYESPKDEIKPASEINQESEVISFSPSALQTFDECQKRYEMKYVYNMPDKAPESWEAITLGTFIHKVLDKVVKENCKTLKEIEDLTKIIQMSEYPNIDLNEAMLMIKVFFERNKSKYNQNSMTEKHLRTEIDGILFNGYADRIDFDDEGNLTIIDYKTGKYEIKPKYRNWQLGIYALAATKYGKPKKLILDMLQKEHPLEFNLDEKGTAREVHSIRTLFDLNEVKSEIVQTAKKIIDARKNGFKMCDFEKNCQFCQDLKNILPQ